MMRNMPNVENGSAALVAGDSVRGGVRPARAVEHAAIGLHAQQLVVVRAAQQRLDDLVAFVAASAQLDPRAKYIGMQGDRMIFEVPTNEATNDNA
jgi:hypothetical protein